MEEMQEKCFVWDILGFVNVPHKACIRHFMSIPMMELRLNPPIGFRSLVASTTKRLQLDRTRGWLQLDQWSWLPSLVAATGCSLLILGKTKDWPKTSCNWLQPVICKVQCL